MKKFSQSPQIFDPEISSILTQLYTTYGSILKTIDVFEDNLGSLNKLFSTDNLSTKIWQWIQLHSQLSQKENSLSLNKNDVETYFRLQQKEVENINDQRLKDLNNHLGEIARIKVSYEGGKRFSMDEAKVLLSSVSCIIAEP